MFYSTCYNMSREHPVATKSFQEPTSTRRASPTRRQSLYQGSMFTSGEEGSLATYLNHGTDHYAAALLISLWKSLATFMPK